MRTCLGTSETTCWSNWAQKAWITWCWQLIVTNDIIIKRKPLSQSLNRSLVKTKDFWILQAKNNDVKLKGFGVGWKKAIKNARIKIGFIKNDLRTKFLTINWIE